MPAPTKRSVAVDLDNLGCAAQPDPQTGKPFSFCAVSHHVLTLPDHAALLDLVSRVLDDAPNRTHPAPLATMKQYVRSKVVAGDPEWMGFLGTTLGVRWRQDLKA
jgi:hypothetical protein